jgi:hypothetical protein
MSQDPEILRVAQGIPQPPCADWGKEHSHASRRCIWHCILQSDYHSLMRQSPDVMLSVLQAHLVSKKQVNEHPLWPRGANTVQQLMRQHTRDKLDFIILIMAIAHSKDERCGRLLSSPSSSTVEQRTPPSPPASEGLTCGPTSAFDVRSLPYRWLPGLPYPRSTLKEGQTAGRRRFEVMHIADYWPGPMWLYHAPGSGVWWDPGPRVIVARNLVDAVLKFKTMKEIIDHLNWVERGDRRVERFRAWVNWRVAYGRTPWETVLEGAAAGNTSYTPFASAGALLGMLLTEDPPTTVDSIILREQSHFWPRGSGWPTGDQWFASSMVSACNSDGTSGTARADGRPWGREYHIPEMVDLRASRSNKRGELASTAPPQRASRRARRTSASDCESDEPRSDSRSDGLLHQVSTAPPGEPRATFPRACSSRSQPMRRAHARARAASGTGSARAAPTGLSGCASAASPSSRRVAIRSRGRVPDGSHSRGSLGRTLTRRWRVGAASRNWRGCESLS